MKIASGVFFVLNVSISILLTSKFAYSFVLLSGPTEAKLDTSADRPNVIFYWNGEAPALEKKEEVESVDISSMTDEQAMEALLGQALTVWSEVPGSYLQMQLQTDPGITTDSEDLLHTIVVSDLESVTTSAYANPQIREKKIADCDITIGNRTVEAKSLLSTIIHEIGHCIGLGHNHTNYKSIMGYGRTSTEPQLGADDMAGIIFLYPEDNVASDLGSGLACGAIGKNSKTSWTLILLILLPLFLAYKPKLRFV